MASSEYRDVVRRLERIDSLMTGEDIPEDGMIVRLDRVERDVDQVKSLLRWLVGVTTAIGIALLIKWLTKA